MVSFLEKTGEVAVNRQNLGPVHQGLLPPHPGRTFSMALPLLRFLCIKGELLHFQPFYRHSYLGCLKPVLNKPTEHFSDLRLSFHPLWCHWHLCWSSGILTGSSLNLVFALGHTDLYNGLNCRSCLTSLLQQCQPWYFLHSFCCFLCCPSSWNKSQGASCSLFLCSNISVLNSLPSKPGLLWDKSLPGILETKSLSHFTSSSVRNKESEGVEENLHSGICTLWQAGHECQMNFVKALKTWAKWIKRLSLFSAHSLLYLSGLYHIPELNLSPTSFPARATPKFTRGTSRYRKSYKTVLLKAGCLYILTYISDNIFQISFCLERKV